MSDTKIATRYAKALFNKAMEDGIIDKVAEDINVLNTIIATNPDFVGVLESPLISKENKMESFAKIFSGFNQSTLGLLNLMAIKRREFYVGSMGRAFTNIYNTHNGIMEATVASASALDNTSIAQIEKYVKLKTGAQSVKIKVEVNPLLIGGITVMFAGKLYDSSIASQINKMKKELNIA